MPKNENVIQFSLNTEQREKLKTMGVEDESIGLTAKRIVLAALGEDARLIIQPSDMSYRLTVLEEKLTYIEETQADDLETKHFITVNEISAMVGMDMSNLGDRFNAIEAALEDIQKQINQATFPVKRPSSPPPPRSRKK